MTEVVGRVVALGYAAVKGTRHVARETVDIAERGVVGDRRWCLVDPTRARVLRTVDHPSLVALLAEDREDSLRLTGPGGEADGVPEPTGERITCDYWGRPVELALLDGPHAALASDHLGRAVRLAAAPPGGVVYAGAVSLVGVASAADARAAQPRLRMNVVLDAGPAAYAEDAWVGRTLEVGDAVLRPGERTPRCAVIDRDHTTGVASGPARERPLARLAAVPGRRTDAGPVLGVDGAVLAPGRVRVGDTVRLGPS